MFSKNRLEGSKSERGAALITTILVSLLLGTACIAMLSAAGASSRNNTDALTEAKTYYAAESGLQAAINFFRNDTSVANDSKYSYGVLNRKLAEKLNYTTVNGISQVLVGSATGYSLDITDPDDSSGSIRYTTVGTFDQGDGTYLPTRKYGTLPDTLTFSFNNQASSLATHPIVDGQPFGSLQVQKAGSGHNMGEDLKFRIDYVTASPRTATRTIRGTISAVNGSITFISTTYSLMGSTITLCNGSSGCTPPALTPLPVAPGDHLPHTAPIFGKMTAIQPYRLKVVSTGYGPNSSTKQLEAIIQRNFLNDLGSSAAISMIGPNAFFNVGPARTMDILGGAYPSVTVSDADGLDNLKEAVKSTNGTMTPPPEIAGNDVPFWQQSPTAMHAFVMQLKQAAQNAGRYFNASAPTSFGDYTSGTGITFCDRNCEMSGSDAGGGILVVTGTFTTSGNPRFKGLVLAVGSGGVVRSGGGNEVFTGNIVVAPYNPNDLAAGWGQPRYDQRGGPGDTINSDVVVNNAFDGTSAITDFMLGVAEK